MFEEGNGLDFVVCIGDDRLDQEMFESIIINIFGLIFVNVYRDIFVYSEKKIEKSLVFFLFQSFFLKCGMSSYERKYDLYIENMKIEVYLVRCWYMYIII